MKPVFKIALALSVFAELADGASTDIKRSDDIECSDDIERSETRPKDYEEVSVARRLP